MVGLAILPLCEVVRYSIGVEFNGTKINCLLYGIAGYSLNIMLKSDLSRCIIQFGIEIFRIVACIHCWSPL